ncbi:hypothetical protein QM012_007536 [Aureobasidium pullulans]|uniref:Uncharacterized protein n=1 Tax=Aureobasidium pullulans TaxID=5580 RepID=A0ABR0TN96_AURPU
MAAFFNALTQRFRTLVIGESVPHDPVKNLISSTVTHDQGDNSIISPNFPDFSTSTYDAQGRDFRFFPEPAGAMRPNWTPVGTSRYDGQYYPTGTSCPTFTVGEFKQVEAVGTLKSQVTMGRWKAMCDECFEDCAQGFWEKTCQIHMLTKQITLNTQFMGRCDQCGHSFHEQVSGI